MDGVAISVGWTVCSTLLMVPAEVCSDADQARFIGGAVMILMALGVSVPSTLKTAQWLSPKPAQPRVGHPKQPYQPLPPMPGPVGKEPLAR